MVAYVHIEFSTCQFSEESKGWVESTPPPGPCGTEKSVALGGLKVKTDKTSSDSDSIFLYNTPHNIVFKHHLLIYRNFTQYMRQFLIHM